MGALLLDEIPKPQTLLGGSIILLAVGVEMYSFEKK
jgi:drug/metabolite transporter (DMT)-like permease